LVGGDFGQELLGNVCPGDGRNRVPEKAARGRSWGGEVVSGKTNREKLKLPPRHQRMLKKGSLAGVPNLFKKIGG